MSRLLVLLVLLFFFSAFCFSSFAQEEAHENYERNDGESTNDEVDLHGSYILVLKEDTSQSEFLANFDEALQDENAAEMPNSQYLNTIMNSLELGDAIKIVTARLTPRMLARLSEFQDIGYVEQDIPVYAELMVQKNVPWGLANISKDHRLSVRNRKANDYIYPDRAGQNVTVYVLDTGVDVTHPEFGGRARFGFNAVPGSPDADENGHGTHVAGIIGSKTFGVAKKCKIVAVKSMKSKVGTLSALLSSLFWTIKSVIRKSPKPAIINMSLSVGLSKSLSQVLQFAIKKGINIVVAAGNKDSDACTNQLAVFDEIITVGASDSKNARASFSNYGDCVKVFAPGVDIVSTWTKKKAVIASGTSMAAPHVSGVAAIFLSYYPMVRLSGYIRYLSHKELVSNSKSKSTAIINSRKLIENLIEDYEV